MELNQTRIHCASKQTKLIRLYSYENHVETNNLTENGSEIRREVKR